MTESKPTSTLSEVLQDERYTRYAGVIDPLLLVKAHCTIIGCGAIGRQVALQLAPMGVGALTLIDYDKVEALNMGCQGWSPKDIGETKVGALADACIRMNPNLKVSALNTKFTPEHAQGPGARYLFSCVDDMDVRKLILECSSLDTELYTEARMTPEVFQVSWVHDIPSRAAWMENWFPQKEAPEQTCSTRTTLHCASAAAAYMVEGFTKFLRKQPLPRRVDVQLLGFSTVATWPAPEPLPEEEAKLDPVQQSV